MAEQAEDGAYDNPLANIEDENVEKTPATPPPPYSAVAEVYDAPIGQPEFHIQTTQPGYPHMGISAINAQSNQAVDVMNRPLTPPPSYSSAVGGSHDGTPVFQVPAASSGEQSTVTAETTETSQRTHVATKPEHVALTIEAPLKPPNYLALSLATCLCCNMCCGVAALYHSSQCDHYYKHGLHFEAEKCSETARQFSIMAMIVGMIMGVLSMGLVIWYLVIVQQAGTH